jgi:hypothetical protein
MNAFKLILAKRMWYVAVLLLTARCGAVTAQDQPPPLQPPQGSGPFGMLNLLPADSPLRAAIKELEAVWKPAEFTKPADGDSELQRLRKERCKAA